MRIYSDMIEELTFWRICSFWDDGVRSVYSEWKCPECARKAFRGLIPNKHCSYAIIEFRPVMIAEKEVDDQV